MQGVSFKTTRLTVRTPDSGDGIRYAKYYSANREFLQPLSPKFKDDMFSPRDWEQSIPIIRQEFSIGRSARFCLLLEDEMIGVANLTNITPSPSYSCILGYTLAQSVQGKGLMREALEPIIDYAFRVRNIHRITANYMPHNQRSGRLLRSLGFEVEGFARNYLLINGVWQDHVMTALTNPNWKQK